MSYPSNHETITWQEASIKLSQLKEYTNNPRKITKEMLDKLASHIKEDGYHQRIIVDNDYTIIGGCLLYTSPSPRDLSTSRMPSSA